MPHGPIVDHNAGAPGGVEAWERVEPGSFRMMLARSPRTGNPVPGLFFRLASNENEVWQITGDRVKRAEGWLRRLYREKMEEEKRPGGPVLANGKKANSAGLGEDDTGVDAL